MYAAKTWVGRRMLCRVLLAGAALLMSGHQAPALAQEDDGDYLAPLVPEQTASDDDLLAPLVPETADSQDDGPVPHVPEGTTEEDGELLAPLDPEPAPEAEAEAEAEEDLLAPLVKQAPHIPKEMSEEELIAKGAQTLRSPDDAHKAIANAIQWAGQSMNKVMKSKMTDEELKKALAAIEQMEGMDSLTDADLAVQGDGPIPLEIDVAEQMEWQRRQEESEGTLVLVEKPVQVSQCSGGVCTTKFKMHYELQPVAIEVPN